MTPIRLPSPVAVFYTISGQPIETDEFEAMQLFADQAALAIKSSRVFRRAPPAQRSPHRRERVPAGGDQRRRRFRTHHRRECRAQVGATAGEAGGRGPVDGAAHRRDRDGKGADRACHSRAESSNGTRDDQGQLRRDITVGRDLRSERCSENSRSSPEHAALPHGKARARRLRVTPRHEACPPTWYSRPHRSRRSPTFLASVDAPDSAPRSRL